MFKKIIFVGMALMMAISTFGLSGCGDNPSRYSEEEHIQRISERIQEHFMGSDTERTAVNIYPLYGKSDEFRFFLIEFEPSGFMFVKINDDTSSLIRRLNGIAMYSYAWNEKGDDIFSGKSPYHSSGLEYTKRYMLRLPFHNEIPAAKIENKWINLISMEEMDLVSEITEKKHIDMYIRFQFKANNL